MSDQAWQSLRASATGYQSVDDLGEADLRGVRDDPQIAGEGHFEAAAEGVSVDRGDGGLWERC